MVLDIKESDEYIKHLILSKKVFSIARVGFVEITALLHPAPHWLSQLDRNAGIYNVTQKWFDLYKECILHCDAFAVITGALEREQRVIQHPYKLDYLALEPFYRLKDGDSPWSHSLLGKKVLIIHPFVESFQKQKDFKMFGDRHVFLEGQEFVFYKSFQTSAGNHLHTSWEETFSIMCQDIQKLDFDIALLGCGGYGLPLVNFIKGTLGKSAIYIGGGLQLLFGVMGGRWEKSDFWKNQDTSHFIRPSGDERTKNYHVIEEGCYW
jgi:hypothetical protein